MSDRLTYNDHLAQLLYESGGGRPARQTPLKAALDELVENIHRMPDDELSELARFINDEVWRRL